MPGAGNPEIAKYVQILQTEVDGDNAGQGDAWRDLEALFTALGASLSRHMRALEEEWPRTNAAAAAFLTHTDRLVNPVQAAAVTTAAANATAMDSVDRLANEALRNLRAQHGQSIAIDTSYDRLLTYGPATEKDQLAYSRQSAANADAASAAVEQYSTGVAQTPILAPPTYHPPLGPDPTWLDDGRRGGGATVAPAGIGAAVAPAGPAANTAGGPVPAPDPGVPPLDAEPLLGAGAAPSGGTPPVGGVPPAGGGTPVGSAPFGSAPVGVPPVAGTAPIGGGARPPAGSVGGAGRVAPVGGVPTVGGARRPAGGVPPVIGGAGGRGVGGAGARPPLGGVGPVGGAGGVGGARPPVGGVGAIGGVGGRPSGGGGVPVGGVGPSGGGGSGSRTGSGGRPGIGGGSGAPGATTRGAAGGFAAPFGRPAGRRATDQHDDDTDPIEVEDGPLWTVPRGAPPVVDAGDGYRDTDPGPAIGR